MRRRCYGCCSGYTIRKNWRWLVCFGVCFCVAVGIVPLVFWAVTPVPVKAKIEDARLDVFSLASAQGASSLAYNISFALAVRNPNYAIVKYTKPLVAAVVFHDRRLHTMTVTDEGDTHKPRKKKLHLLHAGGVVLPLVLDAAAVEDFRKQNATGVFKLEVRLSGEIAYRVLPNKKRELGLSCLLSLPLAPPGPEVVVFRKVSCKIEEPDEIYF